MLRTIRMMGNLFIFMVRISFAQLVGWVEAEPKPNLRVKADTAVGRYVLHRKSG